MKGTAPLHQLAIAMMIQFLQAVLRTFIYPGYQSMAAGVEYAISRQICSLSRVSRRYADTVFIDSITTIAASIFSHPSIDKHLAPGIYRHSGLRPLGFVTINISAPRFAKLGGASQLIVP